MRVSYWQRLEEAKKKGLTREQFEKIEALESAIAHHQNMIDEYEKEIKGVEGTGEGIESASIVDPKSWQVELFTSYYLNH